MCPDCTEDSEWERRGGVGDDDRPPETKEQQASARPSRSKRSVRKTSVQTETKYIELMVVNDNDMVRFKIQNENVASHWCALGFCGTALPQNALMKLEQLEWI